MFLTHRLRKSVSAYSYLETFLIVGSLVLAGYFVDPADPLLIHDKITYITVLMTIITLFHGIGNGLLGMFIIAVAMQFFYTQFPINAFLNEAVFVLIFGEFHYYWNRNIIQNNAKNAYLQRKLDELSNAFYTLKISHDQLEKNYVFKPMSLRNSIRLIKDAYIEDKDHYHNFLTLLHKSFSVSDAEFCAFKEGNLYSVYDKEFKNKMDSSDPMVEMALMKKRPIYVNSEEVENNSRYLAVIPAVSEGKIKGVLLIKEMPFLSFNKDTLISISILIAYFLDEIEKWEALDLKDENKHLSDEEEFYFELKRLYKIYEEFDVMSTILVLNSKDKLLAHLILEKTRENLRSLDILTSHSAGEKQVMALLFPFADQSSAQGFLTRLFTLLKLDVQDEKIEYTFFDISQIEIAKEYAGIETHNA